MAMIAIAGPIMPRAIAGVPAISTRKVLCNPHRDGRNKSGHDISEDWLKRKMP
jgi:hypothetical protein